MVECEGSQTLCGPFGGPDGGSDPTLSEPVRPSRVPLHTDPLLRRWRWTAAAAGSRQSQPTAGSPRVRGTPPGGRTRPHMPMSGLAVPALRLRRSCRQPRRRGLVAFPRHNAQPRSATMPFCLVDLVKVEADLSGRRATCATVGAYLRPIHGPLGGSGMREGRGSGRLGRVRTGLRGPRFPAADGMRGRPVRRGRRGRE